MCQVTEMGYKCCFMLCTLMKYSRIFQINVEECLGSDARQSAALGFHRMLTFGNTETLPKHMLAKTNFAE